MATRNIEALINPLYIGNGSDRVRIMPDGSVRLQGDSTAFDDLVGNLTGQRLNSSSGRVDYDWDESAIAFQTNGDVATAANRLQWNKEILHRFKLGDGITIYPHLHWEQVDALAHTFDLSYRLQRNGYAKATSWTTIELTTGGANDVWLYASGTLNQITTWASVDIDCGVSDMLQFRLARTDNLGPTLLVTMADVHAEIDSFGSDTEFGKVYA